MGSRNSNKKTGKAVREGSKGQKVKDALKERGKDVMKGVAKEVVKGVVKTVMKKNDRSWYTKFKDITPAANINRNMQATFNTSITTDATAGSVARLVDVNTKWTDFADTYLITQIAAKYFQELRANLKSNLPYDLEKVRQFLINSFALFTIGKQLERDIMWYIHCPTDVVNWRHLYLPTLTGGAYGVEALQQDSRFGDVDDATVWASAVAKYNLATSVANSTVRLTPSLANFVEHYFGSVFTDNNDGYNLQYIRMSMQELPYYITEESGTVLSTIDIHDITPAAYLDMLVEFQTKYGLVQADIVKCKLLQGINLKAVDPDAVDAECHIVYDTSFLQTLINGYTNDAAITEDKFIRIDKLNDVSDDLTQFLFMGGLYNGLALGQEDPSYIKPIEIINMVLKYDSNTHLKWPASLSQGTDSMNNEYITFDRPFGLVLTSDIIASTDVTIGLDSQVTFLTPGTQPVAAEDLSGPLDWTYASTSGSVPFMANYQNNPYHRYMFVPVVKAYSYEATDNPGIGLSLKIKVLAQGYVVNVSGNTPFNNRQCSVYSAGMISPYTLEVTLPTALSPTEDMILAYVQSTVNDTFDSLSAVFKKQLASGGSNNPDGAYSNGTTSIDIKCGPIITDANLIRATATTTLASKNQTFFNVFTTTGSYEYDNSGLTTNLFDLSTDSYDEWCVYANNSLSTILSPSIIRANRSEADTGNSLGVIEGFDSLGAWAVDQFDFHIPMLVRHRTDIIVTQGTDVILQHSEMTGKTLLKEAYIPYYYNVNDLIPVMYDMMYSLWS